MAHHKFIVLQKDGKIRLDMHTHTKYSSDGAMSVKTMQKVSRKKGITPIITDHNSMNAISKFKPIIAAEEIYTTKGEILGYFMTEKIPAKLQPLDVIDRLKEQGALIGIPHPFDTLRNNGLATKEVLKHIKKINLFEVYNARCFSDSYNLHAKTFAKKHDLVMSVGSDAHMKHEIGNAYVEMDMFDSKKEFLLNLKKATPKNIVSRFHIPIVNLGLTKLTKIRRKLFDQK